MIEESNGILVNATFLCLQMMNNVDKFLDRLKTFKPLIDDGKIPKKSFDATRSYLELPHFNRYVSAGPRPA